MPVTTQRQELTRAADRSIVRNVHAPYAARRFARTQLVAWRLPGLLDTAELVTSELAANALQHGAGPIIDVRLIFSGDELTIKMWDANSTGLPAMIAVDPLEERGRGLALVSELSEAWGSYRAEPTGKVVWAIMKADG